MDKGISLQISMVANTVPLLTKDNLTQEQLQVVAVKAQFTSVLHDMVPALKSDEGAEAYSKLLDKINPVRPEAEHLCPSLVPFLCSDKGKWPQLHHKPELPSKGSKIAMAHEFVARFYWRSTATKMPIMNKIRQR